MNARLIVFAAAALLLPASAALAATLQAPMALDSGPAAGTSVGVVEVSDGPDGARLALHLTGLPPGPHGFHIHQNGSCAAAPGKDGAMVPAGAAGGHLDPQATGKHMGPMGEGHLGDLPRIIVGADGTSNEVLTAPRLKDVAALKGRTLMIHVGGDNYSDIPAPLGGGGPRLACGILN
jgi:Cu-Zn family superoxide dismutase